MPLAQSDITFLRGLVSRRSGNVLSDAQGYLMESRLAPMAEGYGFSSVDAFLTEVKRIPSRYEDAIAETMTINETSFFRDALPFDTLRKDLMPSILSARAGTKELSIWCAASSSGQEPYSIAMLLREYFPLLATWKVRILATDISDEMLRRTRDGVYSHFEVNRGLPASMLVKHFDRLGTRWQVKSELRRWIETRKVNLTGPWAAMPRFDIVFMRNVLIYFEQSHKQSILQKAARNMAADSILFLGGGESMVGLDVPFTRDAVGKSIFFRPIQVTSPFSVTSKSPSASSQSAPYPVLNSTRPIP